MLHLCAPVDVQLFLAEGGEASSLPAEEWLALAKKLHKANELHWHGFNVYLAGSAVFISIGIPVALIAISLAIVFCKSSGVVLTSAV